jgi:hypothetical protein
MAEGTTISWILKGKGCTIIQAEHWQLHIYTFAHAHAHALTHVNMLYASTRFYMIHSRRACTAQVTSTSVRFPVSIQHPVFPGIDI